MQTTGYSITVKKWYANKVAEEVKRNINMCDLFAILKESEKAVYAVLNLGTYTYRTMWVPKSVLIQNPVGEDEAHVFHHETYRTDDYDEAISEFKAFWDDYN